MQTKKQTIIRLPNVRRLLELLTGEHPRVLAVSATRSSMAGTATARASAIDERAAK